MRMIYTIRSAFQLKQSSYDSPESKGSGKKEFWQAGKSVAGIHKVEPVADIIHRFERGLVNA